MERRILALEAKEEERRAPKVRKEKGKSKASPKARARKPKEKARTHRKDAKKQHAQTARFKVIVGSVGNGAIARMYVGTQAKQQSKHWHSRRRVRVAALERMRPPERLHQPPAPHKEHTRSQYTCFR